MEITKEQLKFLSSKNISFCIPGMYTLTPDQVLKWIRSEDECMADIHGVSVDKYRLWENLRLAGCTALNTKKQQCKQNTRASYHLCIGPDDFKPGYHDRCPFHGGPTTEKLNEELRLNRF